MINECRPIASAPRDGTLIEVMDEDVGAFPMRWNPSGFNVLTSEVPGLWEAPDAGFTWTEDGGFGPAYWRPLTVGRFTSDQQRQ